MSPCLRRRRPPPARARCPSRPSIGMGSQRENAAGSRRPGRSQAAQAAWRWTPASRKAHPERVPGSQRSSWPERHQAPAGPRTPQVLRQSGSVAIRKRSSKEPRNSGEYGAVRLPLPHFRIPARDPARSPALRRKHHRPPHQPSRSTSPSRRPIHNHQGAYRRRMRPPPRRRRRGGEGAKEEETETSERSSKNGARSGAARQRLRQLGASTMAQT